MAFLPKKDEDLFNQSSMSFGEHLIELRRCLINSILWLTLAFIIAMIPLGPYPSLSSLTVDYIQHPLKKSLQIFYTEQSQKKINKEKDYLKSIGYEGDAGDLIKKYQMTVEEFWVFPSQNGILLDSEGKPVNTLGAESLPDGTLPSERKTVQVQTIPLPNTKPQTEKKTPTAETKAEEKISPEKSSANGSNTAATDRQSVASDTKEKTSAPASQVTNAPVTDGAVTNAPVTNGAKGVNGDLPKPQRVLLWKKLADDSRMKTKALNMPETFVIFLKAAVVLALVLASPGIFYNFWSFVGAGLYARERRLVYRFLPLSLILFVAGFCMAFFVVFEMVLTFLLKFNASMNIDPDPRISEWLNLALLFPVAFGVAFQLPLIMFALCRLRIITFQQYWAHWKISVLTISFMSMMLTPPDPWSFTCLFSSVVALYFGGILLCRMFPPPPRIFDSEEDDKNNDENDSSKDDDGNNNDSNSSDGDSQDDNVADNDNEKSPEAAVDVNDSEDDSESAVAKSAVADSAVAKSSVAESSEASDKKD